MIWRGGRSRARGVTLIELIVVIVLLAILGVGFLAMYGDVNRHNAMGSQIAPMTWLAQGAMEAVLAERPPVASPPTTTQVPPYTLTTTVTQVVQNPPASISSYQVTVTVACANGSCQPVTLEAYAYAIQ